MKTALQSTGLTTTAADETTGDLLERINEQQPDVLYDPDDDLTGPGCLDSWDPPLAPSPGVYDPADAAEPPGRMMEARAHDIDLNGDDIDDSDIAEREGNHQYEEEWYDPYEERQSSCFFFEIVIFW